MKYHGSRERKYHFVLSAVMWRNADYIDGLVNGGSNSGTLAMELLQCCTQPSIYHMCHLTKKITGFSSTLHLILVDLQFCFSNLNSWWYLNYQITLFYDRYILWKLTFKHIHQVFFTSTFYKIERNRQWIIVIMYPDLAIWYKIKLKYIHCYRIRRQYLITYIFVYWCLLENHDMASISHLHTHMLS